MKKSDVIKEIIKTVRDEPTSVDVFIAEMRFLLKELVKSIKTALSGWRKARGRNRDEVIKTV